MKTQLLPLLLFVPSVAGFHAPIPSVAGFHVPLARSRGPPRARRATAVSAIDRRAALAGALALVAPTASRAIDKREVAEIDTAGILFKDKLVIDAFPDPKVEGVTLYVSDFSRPITDRVQKDFFSDPSQADLACARTGPIKLAADVAMGREGEEVFNEARSLLFKTLRVRRIYDEQTNTLVYTAFSTRANKNDDENKSRFASSLCAIHVD